MKLVNQKGFTRLLKKEGFNEIDIDDIMDFIKGTKSVLEQSNPDFYLREDKKAREWHLLTKDFSGNEVLVFTFSSQLPAEQYLSWLNHRPEYAKSYREYVLRDSEINNKPKKPLKPVKTERRFSLEGGLVMADVVVKEPVSKKGSHLIPKEKVNYPKELLNHPKLGELLKAHESGDGRKARKGMRALGFRLSDESTWAPFLAELTSKPSKVKKSNNK